MADIKWSAFPSTTSTTSGDVVVGLHSGANEQFQVSATPSASGLTLWDANKNLSANNALLGYTTTATAASSTALTIASTYYQYWTGATTQTVTLPHLTTPVGTSFYFVNNATGVVTVEASGGQTVQAMAASSACLFTCIAANGTTAASWNAQYIVDIDVSGAVLLVPGGNQTITGNYTLQAYNMTATNALVGGNLELIGNTLESTNSNGNINLIPNGTGVVIIDGTTPIDANSILQGFAISESCDINFGTFSLANDGSAFYQTRSRSVAVGVHTAVAANDILGQIVGQGDDGFSFAPSTLIQSLCGGAVSSGIVPGKLIFATANTSGVLTTALTISDAQIVTLANPLGLASGGTGASLTASNGGIFYSNGTTGAILSGTATASQLLLSGSNTTPSWSTSTYPSTNAVNTLLYASSANTMAALATANNGILVTSSGGAPSIGNTVGAGLTMPSITFNSTSGIIGTTTNDNAAAGSVGEVISVTVLAGSAVSITSGLAASVATISLTAGDWDVWGSVWSLPAAGTITQQFVAAINSANALPSTPSAGTSYATLNFTSAASQDNQLPTGPCRISLSTTTTVYLFTYIIFTISTMGAYGQLTARRAR
jgi:hypothetical protein